MAREKDTRLFIRLDLDYADHPKIIGLSDAAFRAHVTMMLYSRKYMTDGVLSGPVANRLGSQWDTDVLAELQSNDANAPSLLRREDGSYELHGFADMQETRAEIDARTARNRANGAKGGRPKKPKETQSVTGSGGDSGAQTKAETETETETDREVAKATSTRTARGARLDPDWMPSREDIAAIADQCPGLDTQTEHRSFVDYWISVAGAKGVKLDWSATWRNWMRRKFEERGGMAVRQGGPKQTASDRARAIADEFRKEGL